jgi:putative membrane protein insertion efficiency factor
MGHRDSSTQLSRHSGIFGVACGTVETDAAARARGIARETSRVKPPPSTTITTTSVHAKSIGAWCLLVFVHFYKIFFSPFLGGACKFYPSCSNYAQEAIELHGARRGAWLALKRLGRCRPFTKGGFDAVPEAEDSDATWLRSDAPFKGAVQSKERAQ